MHITTNIFDEIVISIPIRKVDRLIGLGVSVSDYFQILNVD
jgi:hypothetical protein